MSEENLDAIENLIQKQDPIGVMWRIQSLSISNSAKKSFLDIIMALPAKQRLLLESIDIQEPGSLESSISDAFKAENDLRFAGDEERYNYFIQNILKSKMSQNVLDSEGIIFVPEKNNEFKRFKEAQKTRIIHQTLKSDTKIDHQAQKVVFELIDKGHKLVDENLELENEHLLLAHGVFIEDQKNVMDDILEIMQKYTKEHSADVLEKLILLGMDEDLLPHQFLIELEEKVDSGFHKLNQSIVNRLYQYRALELIKSGLEDEKINNLTDAFIESLNLTFNILGAIGKKQYFYKKDKALADFKTALLAADDIEKQIQVNTEMESLILIYRSLDELLSVTKMADMGMQINDYDIWEGIKDDMTKNLASYLKKTVKPRSRVMDADDFISGINNYLDSLLSVWRIKKLENSHDGLAIFSGLFLVVGQIRKSIGSGIKFNKDSKYVIDVDYWENFLSENEENMGSWRENIRQEAYRVAQSMDDILTNKEGMRSVENQEIAGVIGGLVASLNLAMNLDSGWENDLKDCLDKYKRVPASDRLLFNNLNQIILGLEKVYYAKPLRMIFEDVESRLNTDKPFCAYSFEERKELFDNIISLFNSTLKILDGSDFVLPEKNRQEIIILINKFLAGIDPMYMFILPEYQAELQRIYIIERSFMDQNKGLSEIDRLTLLSFYDNNLKILSKVADEAALEFENEEIADIIKSFSAQYKSYSFTALSMVNNMLAATY